MSGEITGAVSGSNPAPTAQSPTGDDGSSTPPASDPPPVASGPVAAKHSRCGWIAFGDSVGYDAFAANASFYDIIHPDWYSLAADSVSLNPRRGVDDSRVLNAAKANGVLLVPLIASVDDPTAVLAMLGNPDLRAAHIAALADIASRYDGIEIDYEHLQASAPAAFTAFMSALADAIHGRGKMLTVAVYGDPDGTSNYDYEALVAVVDHVHIMGYDHYGTQMLPTAPLGWIQTILDRVAATGAANKFSLGLPNYAFTPTSYCALGDCPSLCTGPASPANMVMSDGFSAGGEPSCAVAGGQIIMYDDASSLEDKVAAAKDAGLGGVTYWSVGGEPAGFFDMVKRHF